eukprot:XP_001709751.1 Hypothetical protein GL50803_20191 [Giardia lamblia ATCC 50803]
MVRVIPKSVVLRAEAPLRIKLLNNSCRHGKFVHLVSSICFRLIHENKLLYNKNLLSVDLLESILLGLGPDDVCANNSDLLLGRIGERAVFDLGHKGVGIGRGVPIKTDL